MTDKEFLLDKNNRPVYVGDNVTHISGGWNSPVSAEIGKIVALNLENEKVQISKGGCTSWVKAYNVVIHRNRKVIPKQY